MNQVSSTSSLLEQKSDPIELLESLAASQANGCLCVRQGNITYSIDLDRGNLTYATHSLDPFERLERHLRRLSHQLPQLTPEIRTQVRLNFAESQGQNPELFADYRAIYWLIEQQYLTHQQAQILIKRIDQEVIESFLLLSGQFEANLIEDRQKLPLFCRFEIPSFVAECKKNLQGWSKFSEHISSPYQRPYFFANNAQAPSAQTEKLGKILKGFNFRQLAAILNQDELLLADKLYPLIVNKSIVLRDASPPFDLLPKIPKNAPAKVPVTQSIEPNRDRGETTTNGEDFNLGNISKPTKDRPWKIACIDDSPTILNEMNRFLGGDEFTVATIDDPLKALMKIIRLEPDIILLDVGMPNIDGYKLCALIRKYAAFKDTPIVMVTGNKGLIDRAKAKLAGATDYMTKPFSQSELLDMVFRYLS